MTSRVSCLAGVLLTFQVLVAIFKYAIALFLMWLLFDLFWFRPLADSELGRGRRAGVRWG